MNELITQLKDLVATVEAEVTRYESKGIRACVPRARKALQQIKRTSQELRKGLSESVKASNPSAAPTA